MAAETDLMFPLPLSRRDRLVAWLLRAIAGDDRAVVINCRFVGGVHIETHNPLGGDVMLINCRFQSQCESDDC